MNIFPLNLINSLLKLQKLYSILYTKNYLIYYYQPPLKKKTLENKVKITFFLHYTSIYVFTVYKSFKNFIRLIFNKILGFSPLKIKKNASINPKRKIPTILEEYFCFCKSHQKPEKLK